MKPDVVRARPPVGTPAPDDDVVAQADMRLEVSVIPDETLAETNQFIGYLERRLGHLALVLRFFALLLLLSPAFLGTDELSFASAAVRIALPVVLLVAGSVVALRALRHPIGYPRTHANLEAVLDILVALLFSVLLTPMTGYTEIPLVLILAVGIVSIRANATLAATLSIGASFAVALSRVYAVPETAAPVGGAEIRDIVHLLLSVPALALLLAVGQQAKDRALGTLVASHARIRDTNRDLRRLNAELDRYAGAVAHDLKAPLTVIGGMAKTLQMPGLKDEQRGDLTNSITRSVDRMARMLDGLLLHARMVSSKHARETVDLDTVVAELRDDLSSLLDESGARVEIVEPCRTLEASPDLIRQLLQNLVINAVRYRNPDRDPVIEVSCEREDDGWRIELHDNGRGIPRDRREAVFRLGMRGPEEDVPGSGIGLATCRAVADAHGGKIWATDSRLGGTAFITTIVDEPDD